MSGIPVYSSSPIKASKASGTTPKTSITNQNSRPTTTSAAANDTPSYPPAQPGAVPGPAPTAVPQHYAPVNPTPTLRGEFDSPPLPQPGAFPTPPRSRIAPPPKVGEKYQPPLETQSKPQPYPPQMYIPPPNTTYGSQPPASSTSTSTTASSTYPAPVPAAEYGAPRQSLEHPPGYHQNAYASEVMSGEQHTQNPNNSFTGLGGSSSGNGVGIDAESIWNTAKQWASTAGSKIQETEADIWRRINKQ